MLTRISKEVWKRGEERVSETERERQTDRQTDRQADRQTESAYRLSFLLLWKFFVS